MLWSTIYNSIHLGPRFLLFLCLLTLVAIPARSFWPTDSAQAAEATDSASDGTPDFLRLDDPADREAFRRWFTFLAEVQYFVSPEQRPVEISDCAALVRYAYREALRMHDDGWSGSARLPFVPALGSIKKYSYPHTPLGAALFRLHSGSFRTTELRDGTFGQFANVETLERFNTFRVGRRMGVAQPGDLLIFRQEGGRMPFHSMIFVGESQIAPDGRRYVVYHTGPEGTGAGEVRRLTTEQLAHYPNPQWRPTQENRSFLGIYRWNILRPAL